jgi:hypothetical protein
MATQRPVLNPTLRLLMDPTPVPGSAGGKSRQSIKEGRLPQQRRTLHDELRTIRGSRRLGAADNKTLVMVTMFSDSLAPTHRPSDFFSEGCAFIAPTRGGYLIEVRDDRFERLASRAVSSDRVVDMADISRVKNVRPFSAEDVLRGQKVESLWTKGLADEDGRLFTFWMMPFHSEVGREEIIQRFSALAAGTLRALPPVASSVGRDLAGGGSNSLDRALREYRASSGIGRAVVAVRSPDDLSRIVASGTVYRIDPIKKVSLASAPPPPQSAHKIEPGRGPIVALIDGGMSNPAYAAAEAWRAPALVPDHEADQQHGNAIASLVTHGAALNPSLTLPALECRFGVAQAVPRRDSQTYLLPSDLYDLLGHVARTHRDTRVWNLSFNLQDFDDDPEIMSDFGHQISGIARTAGALPVISIGNVSGNSSRLMPPADAEAALTVGGRVAANGKVGAACKSCCEGPGPEGALKPEVSWFSPVTVADSSPVKGSSYAAALVSSLAAHTFERLKEPTPDLVRALLINRTERDVHDPSVGWGTPFHEVNPWECEQGSVTMAWNAYLEPGFDYYWRDIPIPVEMLSAGKINGSAGLTAVLQPITSPFAEANYFATRIEVGLQYLDANGEWSNLLGTMRESTIAEQTARNDLKKWQPIRHHKKKKFSLGVSSDSMLRVRAHLYTRDLYQPGLPQRASIPPQRVAFVLTLKAPNGASTIYDTMVGQLGAFVDSAVLQQDIHVEREA